MTGTITKRQKQILADDFKDSFSSDNVYIFIARTQSWSVDNTPPDPIDCTLERDLQLWKNILALKKIESSNVSYAIRRNDWETGSVYSSYADDTSNANSNFYVVTDDFNVYKCLYNNKNGLSTVKPTGRATTSINTADNYRWKYMFTISAADSGKFVTNNFIPVKVLAADDGTNQWSVQQAAANTSIDSYNVTAPGNTYPNHIGSAQSGNTTAIRLATGASATGGTYVGSNVYIRSGTGVGQLRTISGYNGTTKQATVSTAWSVSPDNTSVYTVSPKLVINGDGGGARAYAEMNGNGITRVHPITVGNNYSYATVAITSNTGSGAAVKAHISPKGGHGANSTFELNGYNVMMNIRLIGDESNTFIINNSYRILGLMSNPRFAANNSIAGGSSYRNTTKLNLTAVSGTFVANEAITGGTSGASGYIATKESANTLHITGIQKTFSAAEVITGGTSGATATVNVITTPTLKKQTGDVLYLEYRSPIARTTDQEENFKLTLSF